MDWQGLSIDYGSNDNRVKIGEIAEYMICRSNHKCLHQRLLPREISNFLSESDREMRTATTLFTKKSGCTIVANSLVFKIVFATVSKFVCSSSTDT